jgi:eukaryotic-like serine/threonine-protein kinase
MIGQTISHYRVLEKLGAGGMGEVYRARDTRLGRDVAVKVVPEKFAADAERMARFRREAQVLASLNHPNLAAIYGFEDSGGIRALVMELVEGPTLAERVATGAIPLEEALPIARQIAEGVEYAHERGIVHRDLKPSNIKVTPDGAVKILDFGLAKALTGEATASDIENSPTLSAIATRAGFLMGTAGYMSPEQAKGKAVDRRADIWAFGVVLFEMLAGKRLFTGETTSETLAEVLKAEPDWALLPAGTPQTIRSLLRRCLKKDPRQRLQSIGDARIALEEVLSGTPADASASLPPAGQRISASRWRRALPWTLLAACAALSLALGAVYFGRKAEAPRVLRFTIAPPENGDFGSALALSPDGTRLVFVATVNGKQTLWLRPLASLQAEPISGTEDGNFPFWSPDGGSIGFFASGKLKRVDLSSGSVEALCDVSAGGARGGSWGSRGTILFAPDITKPLMKIASAGGTPSRATDLDASRQDRSHRWPVFLPDGRHFLFLEERGAGAEPVIEAGLLDSEETRPILNLPSDSSVAYAPGFLLYSQNGSLVAQPFDPDRLKLTGAAVPVASNVTPTGIVGPTGYVAVSASATGLLAYRSSVSLVSQLTVVDRSGKTLNTIGPVQGYSDPALSPDRERIMVRIPVPDNPGVDALWLVDVASGGLTRFTFDKADHPWPLWSPDGAWIYFGSNASGAYNIYRKRANGAASEELVRRSANLEAPADISRDGRYLLFSDISPETSSDIWYLPLEPGARAKIFLQTPALESQGRFSPDGRWVAYHSNENSPGDFEVFVAPFPPNGSKWQVSSNGGYWPVWSDDGRELYFASGSTLMAATVKTGATFQFLPPRPLFPIRPPEDLLDPRADYAVFPGGQKFLLNQLATREGNLPISVVANWTEELKRR